MDNCIFCKIINNEIPSYKVYEDDLVLAFLDISPLNQGHTLVIPKKHFQDVFEIEEQYLERIIVVAKKIAEKMKDSLGVEAVNLYHASGAEAEQTVFHFHLHVIPRIKGDKIDFTGNEKNALHPSEEEFREIIEKLKIKL
jgi:histidine triad (HIT) family protein